MKAEMNTAIIYTEEFPLDCWFKINTLIIIKLDLI